MAVDSKLIAVEDVPAIKALQYIALGWHIFPLQPGTKHPLIEEWQHRASCDPAVIRAWWQRWPKAGIAVCCGLSNLAVIDSDPRNGGRETMARLEGVHGPLWDEGCAIQNTGRGDGGQHFFFAMPEGVRLPSKLGPGVDVLSGPRYLVLEPSIHPDTGQPYRWEGGCNPVSLPPLPILPKSWWTPLGGQSTPADPGDALTYLPQPLADTPEERARLLSALSYLSPDCDYPTWQRHVFAILASGLSDAAEIAREWSEGAPDRFDDRAFDALMRSYKDERRHGGELIGVGSIFHIARGNGWKDTRAKASESDGLDKSFHLIPAAEFAHASPVSWLVRSLIQRDGLGVVYGEPGSGKSFLVLDLSAAVALGNEWRGLAVAGGPVVYVAAEGTGGFRKRLQALALHHGVDLKELPLWVVADAPNLLRDEDKPLAQAIQEAGGAALIVVDTLASVTPGGNENSAEDLGAVIARCKRLQAEVDGFVLLVHHSGKDSSRGARGWSGLRGAVDLEIEITRNGEDRLAKVTKQKDSEDGATFPFRLQVVDLGSDGEGNPSTSCAVEHLDTAPPKAPREPTGTVQRIVYHVIKECGPYEVDEILRRAAERMTHDPEKRDKRREHARRAIDALIAEKILFRYGEKIGLNGQAGSEWAVDADGKDPLSEGDQL